MNRENRLKELGISLPDPGEPMGSYATVQRVGPVVYLSGTGAAPGLSVARGRVGREVSVDEAYHACRGAMVALLGTLKGYLGDLNRIEKCITLRVYVNTADGFSEHPRVADGATDLLMEIFEHDELPVRTTVGVNSLPFNIPVELDMAVYAPEEGN
jgi:enamine deaminase RidA (YjgF/YER057c/UK114 family)